MDRAANTILRHKPSIPEELYFGINPSMEVFGNVIVKALIRDSGFHELLRWKKVPKFNFGPQPKLTITSEILKLAEAAISKSSLNQVGSDYLTRRKIPHKYAISTEELVRYLDNLSIENLCLNIPAKFTNYVNTRNIVGVSFPYYFEKQFCGFVTRIIGENSDFVKYTFSLQNRFCWGVDFTKDEVYVIEGIFDGVILNELGFNVLVMGDSQPNYFKMFMAARFKVINLMLDNDYAGMLGTVKAYMILTLLFEHTDVRICRIINGKDPNESQQFEHIEFNELIKRLNEEGAKITEDSILPLVKNVNCGTNC